MAEYIRRKDAVDAVLEAYYDTPTINLSAGVPQKAIEDVPAARLIDANALLRALPDDLPYKGSVRRVLMQAETVDAEPVVRCRECKYQTELLSCGHPRQHGILPTAYPLDFCSYGERREGKSCE